MENKKTTENKRLTSTQNKIIDSVTTLGSGTVTAILGKGGFATVYEIWNPKLEIKRAVKLWHPDISEKSLERFETEIKITAKLHHPNIVEIHNVGEWNKLPYIEMEKINGYCLKEIITQTGALPVEVATAISILICRALTYAHRQSYILYGIQRKGIVHCDIKPANIMITRQGVVKLTDFGLATPTDETLHLETNKVNGSIHYSSPEQFQSIQVDQRTDIYSLGVVMYEMYSGIKAFSAKTLEELIHKRLNDTYTPFHEICHDINPAIKKIVKKCMAQKRDERYLSAQDLLVDLEKVFYKLSKETPERTIHHFFTNSKTYQNKDNKILKISLAVLVTLILAVGSFFAFYTLGTKISNQQKIEEQTSANVPVIKLKKAAKNTQSSIRITDQKKTKILTNTSKMISSQSEAESLQQDDLKKVPKTASKSAIDHSEPIKHTPDAVKNSDAPADESILQQLTVALQKNELSRAEQISKTYQINDGEYLYLQSQLQCIKGRWQDGLSLAEKGFRTPSKRLSADQNRTQYLTSKARCFSAAYNLTSSKENGEKAMEAWFDVKYLYKANPTSSQYIFADNEIRRISKALQNVQANQ